MVDNIVEENPFKCSYFSLEEFNDLFKEKTEICSLLSYNIRSIKKNSKNLECFLNSLSNEKFNFSVISLQELWSFDKIEDVKIRNYQKIIYKGRGLRKGGGVGFFIREGVGFQELGDINIFKEGLFDLVGLVSKKVQEFVQEKSIPLSQWNVHQGSHML